MCVRARVNWTRILPGRNESNINTQQGQRGERDASLPKRKKTKVCGECVFLFWVNWLVPEDHGTTV